MEKKRMVKISTVIYALFILAISFLVLIAVLVYGFGLDNRLTKKTVQIFPYPAAIIDGVHIITMDNLEKNVSAVKKFYESQDFSIIGLKVDFTTVDGQKRLKIKERDALAKLIENRIIEILANQRGIKLTKEAVSKEVAKRRAESGNPEDLVNNLQKLYGWTVADFEAKIVKPDLYKNKLAESVRETDQSNVMAKKKIDQAQADLQAKKDFGEVARKYSEGDSAGNGGELGWFSVDQMLPEIAMAALDLGKGERSEVISSSIGFHIIEVEDKKDDAGVDKLKLRQIFTRTKNFADWLVKQEQHMGIFIPLKDFYWNKELGRVDFSNDELNRFDENLPENSFDDASVLF